MEETLVIWGGEFGRTPMSEKGDGRNPERITMDGRRRRKGGQVIGETDELGHAVKDKVRPISTPLFLDYSARSHGSRIHAQRPSGTGRSQ